MAVLVFVHDLLSRTYNTIHLPCFIKSHIEGSFFHIVSGGPPHFQSPLWIGGQGCHGAEERLDTISLNHDAGLPWDDVFGRPAPIGNDDRDSRCQGLQHHVAEGIRGTWKNENVAGGICCL